MAEAARWIVTGPVGAGKSTVTRRLAERGAVTVDGDGIGHALLREPAVVAAIRDAFGPEVLRDGAVDRTVLGRRVFADPAELRRLNAITLPRLGPLMREALDAAAREASARPAPCLAVLEAAVYFLLPEPPAADLVITVTARGPLRRRRLEAGGRPAEEALRRVAAQKPLARHWRRADVVIRNDGEPAALTAAVDRLLRERLPG